MGHVREWRRYQDWVLQTLVTDPFCVSGLDLGLVKGSPVPTTLYPTSTTTTDQSVQQQITGSPEQPPPSKPQREPSSPKKKGRRRTLEPLAGSPLKQKKFNFAALEGSAREPSASPSRKKRRQRKAALPAQHPADPTPASPRSATSQSSTSPAHAPAAEPSPSMTPSTTLPPQPRAGVGQLPSDSGRPVDCLGLYKVHFRVYALLRHDSQRDEYALFICDLFKLYHAEAPSATLTPGREREALAAKLLTACTNDTATLVPPTSTPTISPLISLSSPGSPSQSISNSLAMRLGNDILSPALIAHFFPSFHSIITDCISLALPHLLPYPGVGVHSFQLYGFDLLWDTRRDEAVLLEVNENVGQGIHPREVMCGQGMEVREYERMKRYWKDEYRKGFSEGVINVTVDEAIGKERMEGGVWREVKRWTGGQTDRAPRGPRPPKAVAWKARRRRTAEAKPLAPVDTEGQSMAPTVEEWVDTSGEAAAPEAPAAVVAGQRRRSSHRRLAEALEHAKGAPVGVTGVAERQKPFLTGQPRGAGGEEGRTRLSRAELHARYAVRARRKSLEGGVAACSTGGADAEQAEATGAEVTAEGEGRAQVDEQSERSTSASDGRLVSSASSSSNADVEGVEDEEIMSGMAAPALLVSAVC